MLPVAALSVAVSWRSVLSFEGQFQCHPTNLDFKWVRWLPTEALIHLFNAQLSFRFVS